MAAKRDELRRKKINTRDLQSDVREWCDRHRVSEPVYFLLDIMSGHNPHNPDSAVTTDQQIIAAKEILKYTHVPASRVEVSAEAEISISGAVVSNKDIVSLAQKLEKLRQGIDITVGSDEIDFDDL